MSSPIYKTIDLFAGIGGIRLGFEKVGFETVFANDFDPHCKLTYDANHQEPKLTIADIIDYPINSIPEFDILLGGFPCQPFSIAGYRQGFQDERGRGNLFFRIADILSLRKPKAFMLENVKNLKTHDNGKTFRVIEATLKDLGYHIQSKVLNSMDYGNVPQNRERVYIVGFRNEESMYKFSFPKATTLSKSVSDILYPEVEDKYYYNNKPLFERIKNDVIKEGVVYQWRRKYVRENKSGVCPTLTANMGMGGHNVPIIKDSKGIRKLTPKECLLLQGYPDGFILPENVSDSRLYKQIGNSVTVNVIEAIAVEMKKAFG